VVPRGALLFIGGLLLLVDDDEPEVFDRREQRRSGADDDVRGAVWGQAADVIALVSPLGDRRVRWELHKRVRPSALILEQTSNGPFVCIADGDTKEQEASKDQRVMDAIDGGCERIDAVTAVTGLPKRTAWNAIRRLRQAGILEPRGDFRRRSDTT